MSTRMHAEIDFIADRCFGSPQFPHHHHHHHHVPSPLQSSHSLHRTRPRWLPHRFRRLSIRRCLHSLPISSPTAPSTTPSPTTPHTNRPRPLPCPNIYILQL